MDRILVCILNYYQDEYVINLINNIIDKNPSNTLYFSIGNIMPKSKELYNRLIQIKNSKFKFSYLEFSYNSGYANGNNELIKLAAKNENFEYVLITNPDIMLENDNLINKMISDLKNNYRYAMVGPKVLDKEGRQAGPYLRQNPWEYGLKHLLPILWAPFWVYRENRIKKINKLTKVWRTIGAFFLIRYDVFESIGFFDEHTFLYWEEDILSYKIKILEKDVIYDPSIKVIHMHADKKGKCISQYNIDSMIYYFKLSKNSNKSINFCVNCTKIYNILMNFFHK